MPLGLFAVHPKGHYVSHLHHRYEGEAQEQPQKATNIPHKTINSRINIVLIFLKNIVFFKKGLPYDSYFFPSHIKFCIRFPQINIEQY